MFATAPSPSGVAGPWTRYSSASPVRLHAKLSGRFQQSNWPYTFGWIRGRICEEDEEGDGYRKNAVQIQCDIAVEGCRDHGRESRPDQSWRWLRSQPATFSRRCRRISWQHGINQRATCSATASVRHDIRVRRVDVCACLISSRSCSPLRTCYMADRMASWVV